LLDDPQALPHLFYTDQIAIVTVARFADGNVEVHALVDVIRLGLTQIPRHARPSQHRPRKAPVQRIARRYDADVDGALLEDSVLVQQFLEVVDELRELLRPATHVLGEPHGNILMNAAG